MKAGERTTPGDHFGIHRVQDSKVQLPQSAFQLDNALPIFSNEILISVERLNIDAASFVQMEKETGGKTEKIASIILENCRTRGKQHNAVTGSGGMLIGKVEAVGSDYDGALKLKPGDRVATLVSLTLTPLHLEEILSIDLKTHQVKARGYAILFESGIAAVLPKDMPEAMAMAAFDVAGAPALVADAVKTGNTVVIVGAGGKAGLLSAVAVRRKIGKRGKIIAIEPMHHAAQDLKHLGVCDVILEVDATNPVEVHSGVKQATNGKMGDVVVNVASVPNTEVSAILSAKPKAKVIFFSMATSFTQVALGAEGIGATATLIFGNGYFANHSKVTLDLLRKNKRLREIFHRRYL